MKRGVTQKIQIKKQYIIANYKPDIILSDPQTSFYLILSTTLEVGTINIPILQMRKLKHK